MSSKPPTSRWPDASDRIREHRERKERLEIAADEARALLDERRVTLDSADAFAAEMSEFLKTSELTETKAFVRSFVKEIEVKPGKAAIVYSIPLSQSTPKLRYSWAVDLDETG